jgi:hypothetical protein
MKAAIDLSALSDQALVSLSYFFAFDYRHRKTDRESADLVVNSVCLEGQERGWPEGWYEDPSVIPSIAAAMEEQAAMEETERFIRHVKRLTPAERRKALAPLVAEGVLAQEEVDEAGRAAE